MIELQESITRENLIVLMTSFYEKAIVDDTLGPFFVNELGDDLSDEDWVYHIGLLADFWLAMLLNEGPYWGNPSGAHFGIANLKRVDFDRWMDLFSETTDEIYLPEVSAHFKIKAMFLAERFMRDLSI
jgi:hemoglobin